MLLPEPISYLHSPQVFSQVFRQLDVDIPFGHFRFTAYALPCETIGIKTLEFESSSPSGEFSVRNSSIYKGRYLLVEIEIVQFATLNGFDVR